MYTLYAVRYVYIHTFCTIWRRSSGKRNKKIGTAVNTACHSFARPGLHLYYPVINILALGNIQRWGQNITGQCTQLQTVCSAADGDLPILLPQHDTLTPSFSIYFSSLNPNKATELTEEPPPAHSKSNIKLKDTICTSFMYVTWTESTVNLKLIDNLIVSPDTSTQPMASCAYLTTESGSFWIAAAVDSLRAISDRTITV